MSQSHAQSVAIRNHTTASSPRPHILYTIDVTTVGGDTHSVSRRYSEFTTLHKGLADPFPLPPKRLLATAFIPSAWVDDALIAERKAGLTTYLKSLLENPAYSAAPALAEFLSAAPGGLVADRSFDLEDALPSTLSRRTALQLSAEAGLVNTKAVTPIAAAYYPDWATSPTVANIDYSKFDLILFAFATPNSSSGLNWDSGATSTLKSLVSAAHGSSHGTKVVLSVGGWGGSTYFSATMSSSANRTTFINALASAVSTYNLDGIDIDWEYPNSSGAGNAYSSKDSANLLTFFKALRTKLGTSKIISAAVTDLPWLGADGNPLTDVSAYAAVMTYANIMNYDVNSSSSTPGANAPLGNLCGTSSQPTASAEAAFSQWTKAGFPAAQLLLGLPLYGYVSQSSKTVLSGDFKRPGVSKEEVDTKKTSNEAHPRVKDDLLRPKDVSLKSWWGQQIPFNSLVASGALKKQSDGNYGGAGGYTYAWDNCSDTPYLYDTGQTTVVTFDDTYSLASKTAFAKNNGMGGCFTWSLDQDDGTTLQKTIRSNLGLS
ncbi:glycoside hydrolase family 18 protein [Plicaturopsis crispa FD-325 SS-3]|nr:glycoside hydrolase family 18 protein [Plicaturopsis crispa FD-325 SS-3]